MTDSHPLYRQTFILRLISDTYDVISLRSDSLTSDEVGSWRIEPFDSSSLESNVTIKNLTISNSQEVILTKIIFIDHDIFRSIWTAACSFRMSISAQVTWYSKVLCSQIAATLAVFVWMFMMHLWSILSVVNFSTSDRYWSIFCNNRFCLDFYYIWICIDHR